MVYDTESGLEWYAGPDIDITWDDAKKWISNLNMKERYISELYKPGGYWRLPGTHELETLYRKKFVEYNMTPLFNLAGMIVWSVDVEGDSYAYPVGKSAFCIYFKDGSIASSHRNFKHDRRVFAVRLQKQ